MRKVVIFLMLVASSLALRSQSFNVSLSPAHAEKLTNLKAGHKRMLKYYKYYKTDSIREMKDKARRNKRDLDSLLRAEQLRAQVNLHLQLVHDKAKYIDSIEQAYSFANSVLLSIDTNRHAKRIAELQLKKISKNRVTRELANHGEYYRSYYKKEDSLKSELTKWWQMANDSTITDSIKLGAKEKIKELVLGKANSPYLLTVLQDYKLNDKTPAWDILKDRIPGLDTLGSLFNNSPEYLFDTVEKLTSGVVVNSDAVRGINEESGKFEQYKNQLTQLSSPDSLKVLAKAKIAQDAIDYFAGHTAKLTGTMETMARILDKYKSFTNTGDLSSAVKRTSLKGKTWWERIVVGGNFNVVSTQPFSIDLSPILGYRFTTKVYSGMGVNYRHTFGDSIRSAIFIAPSNTSIRLFTNWDVFRNFFCYSEIERSGSGPGERVKKNWINVYFVGIGKKLLIHPKVHMVVTALYRINHAANGGYPGQFQMRLGFQSSDLAFRKKKVYYER